MVMARENLRWSARTDEDGRARFVDLPAEVVLEWLVTADGRTRSECIALAAGERRRLEVVLGSGAVVHGRARDEAGRPVAGLKIWLARGGKEGKRFEPGQHPLAAAQSAPDGDFRLDDVPYEELLIGPAPGQEEVLPRAERIAIAGARVEHDLDVRSGLFISGSVVGMDWD